RFYSPFHFLAREWTTKSWVARDGKEHLGRPFTKTTLERLLRNVLYLGQVSYLEEVYAGEQEGIIEQGVWERANKGLAKERNESCLTTQSSSPQRKKIGNRCSPAAAAPERTEPVPRITRLLALALKFEELIGSGAVSNYAALA